MKADLHLHSFYSDGSLSPTELINLALGKSLKILSLTDHDSTDGTEEFVHTGKRRGCCIIPGVEISSYIDSKEIHILGYFVDCENKLLRKSLLEFRKKRVARVEKMVKKLNALGYKLSLETVKKCSVKGLMGRIHVARALLEEGYTKSIEESFARFIGNGKPAHVPNEDFKAPEAIALIKGAQGIPVIAHPGSSKLSAGEIEKLISMGIRGIEVFHPKHAKNKEVQLTSLCSRYGLFPTGGSDFHGLEKDEFDNIGTKYVTLDPSHELGALINCNF